MGIFLWGSQVVVCNFEKTNIVINKGTNSTEGRVRVIGKKYFSRLGH
jgi:hypothetical protein